MSQKVASLEQEIERLSDGAELDNVSTFLFLFFHLCIDMHEHQSKAFYLCNVCSFLVFVSLDSQKNGRHSIHLVYLKC